MKMSTTWSMVVGAAMAAGAVGATTAGVAVDGVEAGPACAAAGAVVWAAGCESEACWAAAPNDIVKVAANIQLIVRMALFSKVFVFPFLRRLSPFWGCAGQIGCSIPQYAI
jgi:hypothetical protein